jgi:hypothetical protein
MRELSTRERGYFSFKPLYNPTQKLNWKQKANISLKKKKKNSLLPFMVKIASDTFMLKCKRLV